MQVGLMVNAKSIMAAGEQNRIMVVDLHELCLQNTRTGHTWTTQAVVVGFSCCSVDRRQGCCAQRRHGQVKRQRGAWEKQDPRDEAQL